MAGYLDQLGPMTPEPQAPGTPMLSQLGPNFASQYLVGSPGTELEFAL